MLCEIARLAAQARPLGDPRLQPDHLSLCPMGGAGAWGVLCEIARPAAQARPALRPTSADSDRGLVD